MQQITASLLAVAALGVAAPAQITIHVPGDQPTIAAAIAVATTNDTVVVAPGTWFEAGLSFLGKAITVRGEGPLPTVIDLQGGGPAFVFASAENAGSILEDITIVNGGAGQGSVLLVDGSSPIVRRCNISTSGGVAILVDQVTASPVFESCTFSGNATVARILDGFASFTDCDFSANTDCIFYEAPLVVGAIGSSGLVRNCRFWGNAGDQVRVTSAGVVEIEDCSFTGNQAVSLQAVFQTGVADVFLRRCRFENNVALSPPYVVRILNARLTIEDCDFVSNTASSEIVNVLSFDRFEVVRSRFIGNTGQALAVIRTRGLAESCAFVGNDSPDAGAGASVGGLNGEFAVRNCTFAANSSGSGAGGLFISSTASPDIVQNCILVANSGMPGSEQLGINAANTLATVSYSNVEGGFPGTGNIDVDPLFANLAGGDVHLAMGSPCIDAGDPNVAVLTAADFEGDPRVLGAGVDLGADEVGAAPFPGTAEDLRLETEVNAEGNVLGPVKQIAGGEIVTIALRSPGGTFDSAIPFLAAQPFATGNPPVGSLPGVHIGLSGFVFVVHGLGAGPLGPLLLPPGGIEVMVAIPPGLAGTSILVQGLVLGTSAQNGVYATTDAHELRGS